MSDQESTEQRLAALRAEHRSLDAALDDLASHGGDLEIRRLKRRKLALKDEIARLESTRPQRA